MGEERSMSAVYSEICQRWYEPDECVYFENLAQSAAYIFRGHAELQDILESNSNPNKMVFAFLRKDHERLKNKWREFLL